MLPPCRQYATYCRYASFDATTPALLYDAAMPLLLRAMLLTLVSPLLSPLRYAMMLMP